MKVTATDAAFGSEEGGSTGAIGSGAASGAIDDHEQDVDQAHHAAGIAIINAAAGVSQWPMLGLSSGTPMGGPFFGEATNVQQALEYLGAAILALSGGSTTPRHWPMLALSSAPAGPAWLSTIKDEGSALAGPANSLDFVGGGVTASGSGSAKTITIPLYEPLTSGADAAPELVFDGAGRCVMVPVA